MMYLGNANFCYHRNWPALGEGYGVSLRAKWQDQVSWVAVLGFLGFIILVKSINRVVSAGVAVSAMVCVCARAHTHGEMEFDDNIRRMEMEFDIQLGG